MPDINTHSQKTVKEGGTFQAVFYSKAVVLLWLIHFVLLHPLV